MKVVYLSTVSFPQCSSADLEALTVACDPATFGLNDEDVLDEMYRKAWKLDTENFATQLSLEGPIQQLLRDVFVKNAKQNVSAELYKLNVYGPGSFFKGHVDTPRSTKMVGSLVIILPTDHEGGSLVFRHHGLEWTFDSAKAVSTDSASPKAAFVTFYSDIEHEVLPVLAGYRVTLTYNIFHEKIKSYQSTSLSTGTDLVQTQIQDKIKSILSSSSCPVKKGDLIGFGLKHKYPFNLDSSSLLSEFGSSLKGLDAVIHHILIDMELQPAVMANYAHGHYDTCLSPDFVSFDEEPIEGDLSAWVAEQNEGCIITYDVVDGYKDPYGNPRPILWLNEPTKTNGFRESYMHYGNEHTMNVAYGDVCIVAELKERRY